MKLKSRKVGTDRTSVKENVSVSKGSNRDGYESLENGTPNDQIRKRDLDTEEVGMSIGSTINMGDFQSLRVDVWGSEIVRDGESRKDAFKRLHGELDEVLQETVSSYTSD